MYLSSGAKEILIRAFGFMKRTQAKQMCVEHLFYGMVSFLEEKEPDPEYEDEQEELASFLDDVLIKKDKVLNVLRTKAKKEGDAFTPARKIFRFATKYAELVDRDSFEAEAVDLAVALMLNPTTYTAPYLNREIDLVEASKDYLEDQGVDVSVIDDDEYDDDEDTDEEIIEDYRKRAVQWVKRKERKEKKKERFSIFEWFERKRLFVFGPLDHQETTSYKFLLGRTILGPSIYLLIMSILGALGAAGNPVFETIFYVGLIVFLYKSSENIGLLFCEHGDMIGHFINAIIKASCPGFLALGIKQAWGMSSVPLWLRIIMFVPYTFILLGSMPTTNLSETCVLQNYISKPVYKSLAEAQAYAGKLFSKRLTICGLVVGFLLMLSLPLPAWIVRMLVVAGCVYAWFTLDKILYTLAEEPYYKRPMVRFAWLRFFQNFMILSVPSAILFLLTILLGWHEMPVWMTVVCAIDLFLAVLLSVRAEQLDYLFNKK